MQKNAKKMCVLMKNFMGKFEKKCHIGKMFIYNFFMEKNTNKCAFHEFHEHFPTLN